MGGKEKKRYLKTTVHRKKTPDGNKTKNRVKKAQNQKIGRRENKLLTGTRALTPKQPKKAPKNTPPLQAESLPFNYHHIINGMMKQQSRIQHEPIG